MSESPVGAHIPHPHEDVVHGPHLEKGVEFDVLSDGMSGPLGNGGLDDGDPIEDNLTINDDLSDFVWLELVEFNMAATQVMLKEEKCDVHVCMGGFGTCREGGIECGFSGELCKLSLYLCCVERLFEWKLNYMVWTTL